MRNQHPLALAFLFVSFTCATSLVETDDGFEYQKLLKKWESLEPIAAFTSDLPENLRVELPVKRTRSLIAIASEDVKNKLKFRTTIDSTLFNVKGGLLPIAFANPRRYQAMVGGNRNPIEIPERVVSVELKVVAAIRNTSEKVEHQGIPIYFQVHIDYIIGNAFFASGEPELWKYHDGKFHLLRAAGAWSGGGL